MAPMSRGAVSKGSKLSNKKRKKTTKSKNTHRFQSFSERIANINVDPVRRGLDVNSRIAKENESSNFTASFTSWKELNLSENFTSFVKEAESLCQNLPQIIHHQEEIFQLLVKYLHNRDALSLEPLLSLVAHLAHDLGPRFEVYFQQTVEVVGDICASHPDVEVIEWSFHCLAWLLKYLSRLLVPDLRPLFDLLSPLLGKTSQKHFVMRFCAEAMSFLLRKAGAVARKDKEPLKLFIRHALSTYRDCADQNKPQFTEGLVVLFCEAVKGVQGDIHSSGAAVLNTLLLEAKSSSEEYPANTLPYQHLLERILVELIHHCDSKTFGPILDITLNIIDACISEGIDTSLYFGTFLIFTILGARKGTRIANWDRVLETIKTICNIINHNLGTTSQGTVSLVLDVVAIAHVFSPINNVSKVSPTILEIIEGDPWRVKYLDFCGFFVEHGSERFETFEMPAHLSKFIARNWNSDENMLLQHLPKFIRLFPRILNENEQALSVVQQAATDLVIELETRLDISDPKVPIKPRRPINETLRRLSEVMNILNLLSEALGTAIPVQSINKLISFTLTNDVEKSTRDFVLGKLLLFHTKRDPKSIHDSDMFPQLLDQVTTQSRSPYFLEAIFNLIVSSNGFDFTAQNRMAVFINSLANNVGSSSHQSRELSLQILSEMYKMHSKSRSEALELALKIERTPPTVENARSISLDIRNLGTRYKDSASNPWAKRTIPLHCFGLLNTRLTPLWAEACDALHNMCSVEGAEDIIVEHAVSMLEDGSANAREEHVESSNKKPEVEDSGCSQLNLVKLKATHRLQVSNLLKSDFHEESGEESYFLPQKSDSRRAQALRVLNKIPEIAEKKSRALVPFLLKCSESDESESMPFINGYAEHLSASSTETLPDERAGNWTRKDKKSLLNVFAKFVNPRVLYRSDDVYRALLRFLSNGDSEIQKSSLKAILQWKSPSTKPYEENLTNLLDDSILREEISTLLIPDIEDNAMGDEHLEALLPIVLRLLYGRLVARSGSTNNRGGQQPRRRAILSTLSRLKDTHVVEFLNIAFGSLQSISENNIAHKTLSIDSEFMEPRKQLGLLKLIKDLVDTMAFMNHAIVQRLANVVLYCVIRASRMRIRDSIHGNEGQGTSQLSLLKAIRHDGLICLANLTAKCPSFDWTSALCLVTSEVIEPGLDKLASENSQGISASFKLLSAWTAIPKTALCLISEYLAVLKAFADCLSFASTREEVRLFVLKRVLTNLVDLTESNDQTEEGINTNNVLTSVFEESLANYLFSRFAESLQHNIGKEYLNAGVKVMVHLMRFIKDSQDMEHFTKILLSLLREPPKRINNALKGEILLLLEQALPLLSLTAGSDVYLTAVNTLSSLFNNLQDRPNRLRLSTVFQKLVKDHSELHPIAELCSALNAYSTKFLDEPDFERRLEAFQRLNEQAYISMSPEQWQPVLYNLLYFVQDKDELSIRSSASEGLRRFIHAMNSSPDEIQNFNKLLTKVLLPELQRGLRSESELVRTEYVSVLGEIVIQSLPEVVDMKGLLGADEESSFFNNILHVQQHRRIRALRKLAAESSNISSVNINRFCLPLIEKFLLPSDNEKANLTSEAITTLEALAKNLEWSRFELILQKKISGISKLDSKLPIRVVGGLVNSLLDAHKQKSRTESQNDLGVEDDLSRVQSSLKLATTLPNSEDLAYNLSKSIVPKLMEHVHFRDESDMDVRVILAVITTKLLMTLPSEQIAITLPRLLMDICNILKSRAQEARDLARSALAEITGIIGPFYFGFILKQLRSSLQRGYQLHVLGYSLHSIIVSLSPNLGVGDLDYCVPELMNVLIDDVFGVAGEEKDSQDYISQMKEVRQRSKSFDSLELLASVCSLVRVPQLIKPLREQIEKAKPRWEKIDEMLARLREGVRRNTSVNDQKFLVLCYEILKESYAQDVEHEGKQQFASKSSCKMASFAFDNLRRVLDKHEALKTAENLAGFLPMINKSIDAGQEEVTIAAIRFLTSIIKVPLKAMDDESENYIRQAKDIIEAEPSTNAPLSQAALRLISAILRERPYAGMTQSRFEADMTYLLHRIAPDLAEPSRPGERERQLAAFNFLKAVLGRGVLLPEVYTVMDTVRTVMVTSAEPPVPDLARGVYTRFVLDYFPDAGKGLARQLDFLVANLRYQHARGRLSVMEVARVVLERKETAAVQPALGEFFIPLVLVVAADEEASCREAARGLLRVVFERADGERTKVFKSQLRNWLEDGMEQEWWRIAFECWGVFFDVHPDARKEAAVVHAQAVDVVVSGEERSEQLVLGAMELVKTLCGMFPAICFAATTSEFWAEVTDLETSKHTGIKHAAAQLVGLYCSHFGKAAKDEDGSYVLPIVGPYGLTFDERGAGNAIMKGTGALRKHSDDQITDLVIQNLSFIGYVVAESDLHSDLEQLFKQACAIARFEVTEATLKPKLAGLRLIDALLKRIPAEKVKPFLYDLLLPLRNITDSEIPTATFADPTHDAVKDEIVKSARELLESIQAKVGTTEFVAQMQAVQKDVTERREERRVKRRIEAVSAPEKAGREKWKRNEANKARRKARNAVAAGRRRGW